MRNQEINKYLTEKVFEECWHEWEHVKWFHMWVWRCTGCENEQYMLYEDDPNKHTRYQTYDFFTNEGCMRLWLKIQECEWWESFWYDPDLCGQHEDVWFIHPDRLAPAVYEFLKERE